MNKIFEVFLFLKSVQPVQMMIFGTKNQKSTVLTSIRSYWEEIFNISYLSSRWGLEELLPHLVYWFLRNKITVNIYFTYIIQLWSKIMSSFPSHQSIDFFQRIPWDTLTSASICKVGGQLLKFSILLFLIMWLSTVFFFLYKYVLILFSFFAYSARPNDIFSKSDTIYSFSYQ